MKKNDWFCEVQAPPELHESIETFFNALLLAIGYAGAFLLLPIYQWIDYKRDCKKHGKEQADEIWRRMR